MKRTLLTIAFICAIVGTGFATAAITAAPTNTIQACVKSNGDVRIVSAPTDCKNPETSISWNVVGPVGPQGPVGPVGPQGPAGPVGAQGPQGAAGTNGTNGTNGIDGVSGYELVRNDGNYTFADGASPNLQTGVSCPSGKKVLGGGAWGVQGSNYISVGGSFPNGPLNETPDTGWYGIFQKPDGSLFSNGSSIEYHVFAICANVN